MLSLLPQLNEKKTASKVRFYLRHDFDKVLLALGKSPDYVKSYVKSPVITGMPNGTGIGNPLENKLIKQIDRTSELEVVIDLVHLALKRLEQLNPEGAELLYRCYIHQVSPELVADTIYRSPSYVHNKLQLACCQFTSCLADVSHNQIDLRVWKVY